jgi:ATP synthase protein I
MRTPMRGAAIARAVCLTQVGTLAAAAVVAACLAGPASAVATAYGGLVALVPTIYLAWRVFAGSDKRSPAQAVGSFYRAEIGKYALTALMLALGVKWFGGRFPALLAGYAAGLLAYWVGAARLAFGDWEG